MDNKVKKVKDVEILAQALVETEPNYNGTSMGTHWTCSFCACCVDDEHTTGRCDDGGHTLDCPITIAKGYL